MSCVCTHYTRLYKKSYEKEREIKISESRYYFMCEKNMDAYMCVHDYTYYMWMKYQLRPLPYKLVNLSHKVVGKSCKKKIKWKKFC